MIENEISIENTFKMRVHFNLVNKCGSESQIWLTATIKSKRVRIYTGQRIEPKYWIRKTRNEEGERAIEDGNFSAIQKQNNKQVNKELKKILGYCHEYGALVSQSDLQRDPIEFSKETFERFISDKIRGREAQIRKDACMFIEDYIQRKESMINKSTRLKVSSGTIYNHKNALCRLQKYCGEKGLRLGWDLFNRGFEEKFTAWLNEKGYAANTIASQYSIMKVWLSEAEMDGFIQDSSFHKYQTKTYDVDNIYLTEDEINRIYNLDFSNEAVKRQIDSKSNIEQTRDMFVVACWTGLRYGDWRDLSKATISDDRIILVTKKTNKSVTIPLHPLVKSIIHKYGGKLPRCVDKVHTISHLRLCGKLAGIDDEITLEIIKGGETEFRCRPKYDFISNHTARRSFVTNMYLKKVPTKSIMAITGHTTETNFMKYIKVDQEQHAKIVESYFDK